MRVVASLEEQSPLEMVELPHDEDIYVRKINTRT